MKVEQVYITYRNGTNYEFTGSGMYDLDIGDDAITVSVAGEPVFYELTENIKDFGVVL